MRYSRPRKAIVCVSLAIMLCLSLFAQEVFWGWASDDSLGASGKAVGYSLGVSPVAGTLDASDLQFEFPTATHLSGVPIDPHAGVKVINNAAENEADRDVTQEFDLDVTYDHSTLDLTSPAAGTHLLQYTARHKESILIFLTAQREIEVEEFGGDAYVKLGEGSRISIGGESYLNLTANLDTGATQGRYIRLKAQQTMETGVNTGITFDLTNVSKIEDIEEMTLLDNDQTLLLTISESANSVISIDFPVQQTIDSAINGKLPELLDENTAFAFTAELFVGLSGMPHEVSDAEAKDEDDITIPLEDYDESTLTVRRTVKNINGSSKQDMLDIDNYNTAVVRDGAAVIDTFNLNLAKTAGMRSSYKLELIVPIANGLEPVVQDSNVAIEEDYNGEKAFVITATNSALLSALANSEASYTHQYSNAVFSFTPAFSNLGALTEKKAYKAENPIILRIHQYGTTYEQVLENDSLASDPRNTGNDSEFYFTLTNGDYATDLLFYVTPTHLTRDVENQELTFRPDYTQYEEMPYDEDLEVVFTMPLSVRNIAPGVSNYYTTGRIKPQSLVLGPSYGNAKFQYTLSDGKTSKDLEGEEWIELTPGDRLTFQGLAEGQWKTEGTGKNQTNVWYPGVYVASITYKPDKLDTRLASKGIAFYLYSDVSNASGFDGNTTSLISLNDNVINYEMTSEKNYGKDTVRKGAINLALDLNTFRWDYADAQLNQKPNMHNGTAKTYYLENRPEGDQRVAYLHFKYKYRMLERNFDWEIHADGTDAAFLKSLTGISHTTSNIDTADISRYSVTYTTRINGEITEEVNTNLGEIYKFKFADESDYLTSLKVNYTIANWSDTVNYQTLFQLYMDLNKYKTVTGGAEDLPSDRTALAISSTVTAIEKVHANGDQANAVSGVAGNFVYQKQPYYIKGDNLQISQSRISAQGGDEIALTLSRLITSHNAADARYVNGDRMVLKDVTTYIPVSNDFYIVDGSVKVDVNSPTRYQSGDLSYSYEVIRGSGSNHTWLVIHWSKFTTGGSVDGSYVDDPKVTFTVKSSPLIQSQNYTIIPGSVYNNVYPALDSNDFYVFTNAGKRHNGVIPNLEGSPSFANLTVGSGKSNIRILAANKYGVQLFTGANRIPQDSYMTYLNHERVQAIVKMNYKAGRENDGRENSVIYLPIPQASDNHPGMKLVKAVELDGLPEESHVAYSTLDDPDMELLGKDWDAADNDFSEDLPDNPADVKWVRIVGVDLDESIGLAYITMENRSDKEMVGAKTLYQSGLISHKSNPAATKAETVYWELGDYTVTGVFWDDEPDFGGSMAGKSPIGGAIHAQKNGTGRVYPTATVTAAQGYTMALPSYGEYTFTARSSGYVISGKGPDNQFEADGTRKVEINANYMAVNAGFKKDSEDLVTVVFISNGDTDVPSQTGKVNETITDPGDPTREGYLFQGWFLGDDKGEPFADSSKWVFAEDKIAEEYRGKTMYLVGIWALDGAETGMAVSEIDFGSHKVPSESTLFKRVDPTEVMTLEVLNAPPGEWNLTARCTVPFTLVDENGTYIKKEDGSYYQMKPQNLGFTAKGGKYESLDISVPVIRSSTQRNEELIWDVDSGIQSLIGPRDIPKDGNYRAVITWSINQGPYMD